MLFDRYKAARFAEANAYYTYEAETAQTGLSTPGFPLPLGDINAARGNDCTNFVSQCLMAGGWKMITDRPQIGYAPAKTGLLYPPDKRDLKSWFYEDYPSITWVGAPEFAYFVQGSERGKLLFFEKFTKTNIKLLKIGDVIQQAKATDFERIHHTAIVTRHHNVGRICQHSGFKPIRDFNFLISTGSYWAVWRMYDSFAK